MCRVSAYSRLTGNPEGNPVLSANKVIAFSEEVTNIEKQYKTFEYFGKEVTVSNDGQDVICDGKHKNIYLNRDGYPVCSIKIRKGRNVSARVARLVALAFIPNPNNLPEVNHKDYDRQNSSVENLEWMTHADNVRYSQCNRPDYRGNKNPNYGNRKLSEKYKNDKELSKEKQGRPGVSNGRSTPVDLYYDDQLIKSFDYIIPCCQYLIDIGVANTDNVESVRVQLNRYIKEDALYKKHSKIVKK